MSFVRIKEIGRKNGKKYRYAYVVENRWRKRIKGGRKGSRQRVKQYLGKVLCFETEKKGDFFEFIGKAYENKERSKKEIVEELIRYELFLRGFKQENKMMEREQLRFDLAEKRFVNKEGEEERVVLEMNEGFLSKYTIRKLVSFKKNEEDERETGIRLAKTFLEAGLRVPKELFIEYFEKI